METKKSRSPNKCPAYLSRNPYSYCFRIKVPPELHRIVGRRELRYSLKTNSLSDAKYQARRMAGLVQWLYHDLGEQIASGKVADFDIDPIMHFFLRDGQFTIWDFPISKPALKERRPRRARGNSTGSLQKVIETYVAEQDLGGNWTPRTKLEVEACLNLLLSFCGNVSISSITFKKSYGTINEP